ncbi:MAG: flagellar export chaperone FlgN [Ruminiclostridium sp.]|nr:flagellar export chaperone FlgN [Ruminiclostridium sp.]
MTPEIAKQVIIFMEKYNKHFEALSEFVSEKRAKVIADDLTWLLDSLTAEQKFIMEGNDLEAKRLALFQKLGLAGKKARMLVDECPEELKAKLTLECSAMEKHVEFIKATNADIIDIIERKLSVQEKLINRTHTTASTYTGKGVKVTKHNTSGGFFGNV